MVVVLGDNLLQLLEAVLLELRGGEVAHVAQEGGPLEGDFGPDQDAALVAEVVEVLRVGHYRRAYGVGPQVADAGHVGVVVGVGQGAPLKRIVVVERHAVDGAEAAVEGEALLGGDAHRAEARADAHLVEHLLLAQPHGEAVECRMVGTPQLGVVDREGYRCRAPVEAHALAARVDARAVGSGDVEREQAVGLARRGGEVDFGLALDPLGGHRRGLDQHAVRTEVEGRDGRAVGDDELGAAVDAAVEVGVGRDGQHVRAAVVAHDDQQRVLVSAAQFVGDFEGEGRRPAAVFTHVVAVDEERGDVLHAVELHEDALAAPFGGDAHLVLVVGRGFEEEADGFGVGVPGMGQCDVAGVVARVLRLEEEAPPLVQRVDFTGLRRDAEQHEQQGCCDSFHGFSKAVWRKYTKFRQKLSRRFPRGRNAERPGPLRSGPLGSVKRQETRIG